jgi:type IV conjugative transfer system protein TraL
MSNDSRYYIPRFIDEPARYVIFTLDELVLFVSIVAIAFVMGHEIVGFLVAAVAIFSYQKVKSKEPSAFIQKVLYKYFGFGPKNYIPTACERKFKG